MGKKILDITQSIIGIIGFLSFFAVFISLFFNKDYALLFFSLFFLFIPTSLFLNKFTKNKVLSKRDYFLIIVLFLLGLIGSYFTLDTFKTKTVSEIKLTKTGDVFSATFKITADIELKKKQHTFYAEIKYSASREILTSDELILIFTEPNYLYSTTIDLNPDKTNLTVIRKSFKHNFIPTAGSYSITVSPKEKISPALNINSIKIIIREYRI